MSKAVHWQVPFCSLKGVQYLVDIYDDDYTGSPVQLTGGATPFVTDEDNDDNFFAPVRTQTGQLTVIDMDGTLMETLIPSDNTARPVRLIRVSDSAVMWQGFLSCEAYSQDYTSRAQELTLNVNSVLAAMDSVQMDVKDAGIKKVRFMLVDVFDKVRAIDSNMVKAFVYPKNSYTILNKYIDTTVMFEKKEQDNENSVTYSVSGMSLKEALERICTYMGWCVREVGDGFYFQEICGGEDYYSDVYERFRAPINSIPCSEEVKVSELEIGDHEWRGTGHEIEVRQGAKSVEVVAKVDGYDMSIGLPDMPVGDVEETTVDQYNKRTYSVVNVNTDFDSSVSFRYVAVSYQFKLYSDGYVTTIPYPYDTEPIAAGGVEISNLITAEMKDYPEQICNIYLKYGKQSESQKRWVSNNNTYGTSGEKTIYNPTRMEYSGFENGCICSAFMARVEILDVGEEVVDHDYTEGLYLSGFPVYASGSHPVAFQKRSDCYHANKSVDVRQTYYTLYEGHSIIKLSSVMSFTAHNGWLNIQSALKFAVNIYGNVKTDDFEDIGFTCALKFAGKYWNGSEWSDSFSTFVLKYKSDGNLDTNYDSKKMSTKKNSGHFIPITELMVGNVEFMLFHRVVSPVDENIKDLFIDSLDVSYCEVEGTLYSDRSENHYFKLLGLNFSDEISVNVDIASNLNNKPSPSVLMNSETEVMKALTYADGTSERPEKNLLNRLAEYYKTIKRKISLEIERPTTVLPLAKVSGYDDKTYIPLIESRDWRMDKSTVTMFET